MKRHAAGIVSVAVLFFISFAPPAAQAQGRGPSTPEERARAVRVAHALEDEPLGKDAKEERGWMLQWITDIPDITVTVCNEYFGKLPHPPRGYSQEIVTQMTLSSTAFMIEHPDKAKDEQAVALAGLLGALKAYQAILKQDPSARWPYLDRLVAWRDQSKLDDYVAETRRKCESEGDEPEPGTVRTLRFVRFGPRPYTFSLPSPQPAA